MDLFFYLKHFPPYGEDLHEGTRKAVHGLAAGIVACGAKVTILCEWIQDSEFQSESGYTIRCFKNPKSRKTDTIDKTASFTLSPDLEPFLVEHRQNSLFILNGIFHRSLASLSQLLRKHSIPYIVAPHDVYHPAIFKKNAHLKWPYWYLLEKQMLQKAKAIQVLDRRQSQWLQQLNIQTSIIEVPNGFTNVDTINEVKLNYSTKDPVKLFFFSRLDTYHKGIDLLLNAFAQVAELTEVELTLQGPDWGNEKQYLEAYADRLGIIQKVKVFPPEYTSSPIEIIANYDIFCVPSRFEGFSLSALEAMLAGRPVLVSEGAGIAPHVLASKCGVVVQPDIESIKSGLLKLIQKRSEWEAMGFCGRHYVLNNLSWKKIAANALEEYYRLIMLL
ncbi:glycosyltransferase [Pantanalinema rosaneae CENA516]|uniref:glycosyltransferase n=1 Tax=Pantanalinema rosaneae TaxID=1620701 RepID=UPI003D6E9E4F